MDRTRDSVSAEAVARADLHEALGRREGEDHRVSGVGSEQGTGVGYLGYWRLSGRIIEDSVQAGLEYASLSDSEYRFRKDRM